MLEIKNLHANINGKEILKRYFVPKEWIINAENEKNYKETDYLTVNDEIKVCAVNILNEDIFV